MRAPQIDDALIGRLYGRAKADRWNLPLAAFAEALQASAARMSQHDLELRELERYLETLHLEDLALACACAEGSEAAWEHFMLEHRPLMYRAADVLDASGGARELADSLYADLYGLTERGGLRQSLFRYFHGRSSLTTWLRSVLAQRYVDRLRAQRRVEPLTDREPAGEPGPSATSDLVRMHYVNLVERALRRALDRLEARDRLRLACYYAQDLTLVEIGRLLGEHEATASRHLARTRRVLRKDIEQHLREEGCGEAEIEECLASAANDAGPIDLRQMLGKAELGKNAAPGRSIEKAGRREHEA